MSPGLSKIIEADVSRHAKVCAKQYIIDKITGAQGTWWCGAHVPWAIPFFWRMMFEVLEESEASAVNIPWAFHNSLRPCEQNLLTLLDTGWNFGYNGIYGMYGNCWLILINSRSLIVLMAFGALHPLLRYDQNDQNKRNALHKKSERHERPWIPKRPCVPENYFYF